MNLVRAPGNGYEEGLDAGKGVRVTPAVVKLINPCSAAEFEPVV